MNRKLFPIPSTAMSTNTDNIKLIKKDKRTLYFSYDKNEKYRSQGHKKPKKLSLFEKIAIEPR